MIVLNNFSFDQSCLSLRDWVQDVISKYGIGKYGLSVNIHEQRTFTQFAMLHSFIGNSGSQILCVKTAVIKL